MTRTLLNLAAALAFALAAQIASADVLLIEEVRQSEAMVLPKNGITKAEAETQFGAPNKKTPAVGEPPISKWEYKTFNVYFENDLVLFSVLNPGAVIEK